MDTKDKQWTNIRNRFYTIKPIRKFLYINQYEIEKQTNIPVALHLMFSEDKIKEEFLYSENTPVESLMNGISNPYIIGVCKNNDSFYLIVHPMPKHPGWHNGSFITTYYNLLYCYHELHFMKGSEIFNSISDDVDIKTDIYKRLELMGDSNSIISKYYIYEYFNKYNEILIDIILILKKINVENHKNTLKSFIISIKIYMKTYKDFHFDNILKKIFIYFYENNKIIASYMAKNLKKELKNINKDGHSTEETFG